MKLEIKRDEALLQSLQPKIQYHKSELSTLLKEQRKVKDRLRKHTI